MSDISVEKFARLVSSQTGIREENTKKLQDILVQRMQCLKLHGPAAYVCLLKLQSDEALTEWNTLMPLLMNSETYFFRDQGQFTLLKDVILPDLIERQKVQRSLRIWSAGCSSGEEPYSLAILVDQLLPGRKDWNVSILGTDINPVGIQKAQQGIYGPWAFRLVSPDLQRQYFIKQTDTWTLKDHIRDMVTFRRGNLYKDAFPSLVWGVYDMDLILCRNVFLYFQDQATEQVLKKMTDALRNGGYLMTGHNELRPEILGELETRVFTSGIVYQRRPELQSAAGISCSEASKELL